MKQPLPLRPTPKRRETVPSFLARLSAINFRGTLDFTKDMGFSFKEVLNLEETALARLAQLGGLDANDVSALVSWTGQVVGDHRTRFRDEVFISRAVKNPIIRGCPMCLREDAAENDINPLTAMTMRGDWQFREISICVHHHHPLVQLWSDRIPTKRFDFANRLTEILPKLLNGELEQPLIKPSPYDVWLDNRLETGRDETWLADYSLYATTTFIRLIGTELLRLQTLPEMDENSRLRLAQASGFDVVSRGETAIRNALQDLVTLASKHTDKPSKTFGRLYSKLANEYCDDSGFAPFRQILRDCILTIWPVAVGEDVLGVIQPKRLLHSVNSAAQETGIGRFLLEQFLLKAGAISPDGQRSRSRKTFDAEAYSELLEKLAAELPTLVGPLEMQKAMGATQQQFRTLATDGVLLPRIDIPTIKAPWRISDGLALVSELTDLAEPIALDDNKWEIIQEAKKRSMVPVGKIIAAVRKGQLRLGQQNGISGYRGFCVLKAEINEMQMVQKVPQTKDNTGRTSAAAFGRTVGIRDKGRFLSLVLAGHTPATFEPHPKFGNEHAYVSEVDIAAFHRRFLTSTTMATEFGEHWRTLALKLTNAGVARFGPNGADFGALYIREDVEAALHKVR